MKQKPLNDLTTADLVIEVKKRQQLVLFFATMLTIIVLSGIFLTIKQGFGVFTTVPIAFVPILILIRKNATEAKKELESRK